MLCNHERKKERKKKDFPVPTRKRSNTSSCAIKLLVLPLRVLEKLPDAPVHTVLIWPIYPSLQQAGRIGAF